MTDTTHDTNRYTRRSRRGAPQERRLAMIQAASEVFFEAGYAAASIDMIIARAGGSKRDLYAEFGNKEGLFAAIITENASRALDALAPEQLTGHDLRSTLRHFGRRLVALQMAPQLLALYRAGIAESTRFPDLARAFFESGPGRASARLAEVLEEYRDRGEIKVSDCRRAAEHFIGMVRDDLHLQVLLGLRPPPNDAEVEATVDAAVRIFLDGVGENR
ncbi:TetR/AcrR family transcriptional regulator [Inquilinus sp. CAU 1745]|uniref:TetR/AcrR family transcriptional regulator n=1 Tax=Inquilinus sp. CAU 1745 TaxID=3140369 RepID=UPI00325B0FA1